MQELIFPILSTEKNKNEFISNWLKQNLKTSFNKSISINLLNYDFSQLIGDEINYYSKKISRLNKSLNQLNKLLDEYQHDYVFKKNKSNIKDNFHKYISVLKMNSYYSIFLDDMYKNITINLKDIGQINRIKWINLQFVIINSFYKKENSKNYLLNDNSTEYNLKDKNENTLEYSFFFPENSNHVVVFTKINLSARIYRCNAEFWCYKKNNIKLILSKNLVKS